MRQCGPVVRALALRFREPGFKTRSHLGPVSRKSRNFTGHFRVSQFPLFLKNGEDLSRQTLQLFRFLLP